MSDYVTLMGAEKVQDAGRSISQAAQDMNATYSWFSDTLQQHHRFMDDWLTRFEQVLADHRNQMEVAK